MLSKEIFQEIWYIQNKSEIIHDTAETFTKIRLHLVLRFPVSVWRLVTSSEVGKSCNEYSNHEIKKNKVNTCISMDKIIRERERERGDRQTDVLV